MEIEKKASEVMKQLCFLNNKALHGSKLIAEALRAEREECAKVAEADKMHGFHIAKAIRGMR